ncbi:hypothetical protein PRZ48_012300 [Zasmidium cellare]|uniref:Uncharacterized protein n=1 Tax=Zasmidium cellare TaxID=395010 RepID=A0ABR0E4M4_ZASCE|nr:hypothetical protein PRZ48_012300 [Zasmidium cellare]
MRLNCFCAAPANLPQLDQDEAPRLPRKKTGLKRQGTGESASSRCSTASNSSISKLPPCKRDSDAKIEAMMMPEPTEGNRPSRCLRMSHPKTYSNIVDSMKKTKGCRDWRNFQVFYNDEIDMTISANDVAKKRADDYERRLRELSSFGSNGRDFAIVVILESKQHVRQLIGHRSVNVTNLARQSSILRQGITVISQPPFDIQVVMKRFIFGDYNIDWRSIPAVDEDSLFNRATLLYRRDLRCKASREYYMEILNGFRIKPRDPSASISENNTVLIDGEEVVDMIG